MEIALHRKHPRWGFTLLELAVVVFLLGIISAVAFPRLLPLIAFTRLEGEARHLSNYGRSVIAQATLMHEKVTVRFDLDNREYYAVHWVFPEAGHAEGELEEDQWEKLRELRDSADFSPEALAEALEKGRVDGNLFEGLPDGFDDELANLQMDDRFAKFVRRATLERAKNVKHKEGILEEIGPLFEEDEKFSLSEEDEPEEVEYRDPSLQRRRVGEEVVIESIEVDAVSYADGVVEIELSALGLRQAVVFYLTNGDDYYTVLWDPVSGDGNVFEGKETFT